MIIVTAALSIGAFMVALWWLSVVAVSRDALSTAGSAVAAMRDPALDDAARERIVQRASLSLLRAFVSILARSALALACSLAPIGLAHAAGLAPAGAVIDFLSRWDVIVVATVVIIAAYVLWRRPWAPKS